MPQASVTPLTVRGSTPLAVLAALVLGCGATTREAPVQTAPSRGASAAQPALPASRALSAGARYSELVQGALALEGRSAAGACLLAQRGDDYELGAELSAAVRPLPSPAEELDPALKQAESVELLSSWGRYGNGGSSLSLASFTAHPPARDAIALMLTDRGIALRGVSGRAPLRHDDLSAQQASDLLVKAGAPLTFVAAEAAISLAKLHEVLAQLDAQHIPVALAVNLSSDTKLPVPARESARVPLCSDGLPATDAPEGGLPPSELQRGLAALREHLPDCLLRGDASGAAGGKLALTFRINPNGRVQDACISQDGIGDPGVGACVIELARALSFAPPAPSGVLDIELPLALRPSPSAPQPATCAL